MLINDKYKIEEIINEGSFGLIAKGSKVKDDKPIIIKFDTSEYNLIKHETFILNYLNSKNISNIPSVIYYGIIEEKPCLIIPYYDCNLNQLILNNKLEDKHSLLIIKKVISVLENVHEQYVIHRDIKPDNIMLKNNNIYIIDFGLATFYLDGEGEHIENKKIEGIIGSYNYCSCYINELNTPSRRDDIISTFYILIYLLFKKLPWEGTNNNILRKSKKYITELLNHHSLSSYLQHICHYVFSREHDENPSYKIINDLLDTCLINI